MSLSHPHVVCDMTQAGASRAGNAVASLRCAQFGLLAFAIGLPEEFKSAGLMVLGSVHDSMTRPGISFAQPGSPAEEWADGRIRSVAHVDWRLLV